VSTVFPDKSSWQRFIAACMRIANRSGSNPGRDSLFVSDFGIIVAQGMREHSLL